MALIGAFMSGLYIYLLATSGANPVLSALLLGGVYGFGAYMYVYYAHKNAAKGITPSQIYGQLPPE